MRLTVLGAAGTFPQAGSPCSGYLFRADGFSLLVDAGNGVVGAMQREIGLLDLDAVLLSHLHADHCVDLVAYSYARRYHPEKPPPIPVHGPAGARDRLVRVFDAPPRDGLAEVYDFRRAQPGRAAIGPFEVELARTNHPVETYAVRVSHGGRSVTYSADTGPSRAVAGLARGTDLFVCESTWQTGPAYPPNLHLTARQAAEHALTAEAGSLLLTHTTAYLDRERYLAEAADVWSGPLALAEAGRTYEV